MPRLARRVADAIIHDVIARDWPVGDVIGSEADLLRQHGVSRSVLREAVRIVEHLQIARMRRGPGGGLVVAEPAIEAVTDAVLYYLHRVRPHLDEVMDARLVLEDIVVELVPERLTEHDIGQLRSLSALEATDVVHPRELHELLATMTRNPALALFIDLLSEVTRLYVPDLDSVGMPARDEAQRAHARIVDAVLAGDVGLARHRMRTHLAAEAMFIRTKRGRRHLLPPLPTDERRSKRAETVAAQIFRQILADGWPVGTCIASEAELMERYDVSRSVLREAVRLLEHHQVARMRRGPGGGLLVTEPSVSAVTDAVAIYLERRDISGAHLAELRRGVELALVTRAIERLDADGTARLEAALTAEHETPDAVFGEVVHDVHAVIAALSGNRVLELVALVLVRLTRLHHTTFPEREARRRVIAEVQHSHAGIVAAITARDVELACHRMRRHLDALAAFLH